MSAKRKKKPSRMRVTKVRGGYTMLLDGVWFASLMRQEGAWRFGDGYGVFVPLKPNKL